MKLLKRSTFLLFVLILASLIAGCTSNEEPAQAEETDTIRLALIPYLSNTVFQIAIEEGYFEEQDINVEVINVKNAGEMVPLLLAGEIDATAPGLSAALFNAFSKGGEMKVILALSEFKTTECPYIAYLARTEDVEAKLFEDKSDWSNASIVISSQGLNSVPGYILSEVLAGSGVTIDDMDVKIVEMPAHEDALLSGQVDIVYAIEPSVTRLLANENIAMLEPGDPHIEGLDASVIAVGPKIYEDEDLANRFAVAYLKAVRQYLEGPTERNIQHAAQLTGLDEELVKEICWSYAPADGRVNIDSINTYQNFLMERGQLDEFVESDVYYDPSFAEFAVDYLANEE